MFGGFYGYYGQETWEYYNTDPGCCETLGVTLDMPSAYFRPGDTCYCNAIVCNNTGMTLYGIPLFVLLDVYGNLYWGPDFTPEIDTYLGEYPSYPESETVVEVIPSFTWPEGAGSGSGIKFYAAMTDPNITFLYGDMDVWEFGWEE